MDKKSIMVFGVGKLQKSLIERCKEKGFHTIGIDPSINAACKDMVDHFEVVSGNDYEQTLLLAIKFDIVGIITSSTDKPLVMMARVAEKLKLPFISVETATLSTDKYLMKQKFLEAKINCAGGFLVETIKDLDLININYPVIVKPRDSSGSRGVKYCKNYQEVIYAMQEAKQFTHKHDVLIEEYIEGKEYSVEGIHLNGESKIIQITEKITTEFPYNVELAHLQPSGLGSEIIKEIVSLVSKIATSFSFTNCASHTEIRINSQGIFVIETSPRLGGDYITSHLVPLSTGVNIEDCLIDIAVGEAPNCKTTQQLASAVQFLNLRQGTVREIGDIPIPNNIKLFEHELSLNKRIYPIKSSIERYGFFIVKEESRLRLMDSVIFFHQQVIKSIIID